MIYKNCRSNNGLQRFTIASSMTVTVSIKCNISRRVALVPVARYKIILIKHNNLAPSQWETSLHRNAVSHWLGASLESALFCIIESGYLMSTSAKRNDSYRQNKIIWFLERMLFTTMVLTLSQKQTNKNNRSFLKTKGRIRLSRPRGCKFQEKYDKL